MTEGYIFKTEELLGYLGFDPISHIIWVHKTSGTLIHIPYDTEPEQLYKVFMELGSDEQNKLIRSTIGL